MVRQRIFFFFSSYPTYPRVQLTANKKTGTAKKDIPPIYHTYQFQGGLVYNETHELYVQHSDPTYVGPPSAEIDRAWKDIVSRK